MKTFAKNDRSRSAVDSYYCPGAPYVRWFKTRRRAFGYAQGIVNRGGVAMIRSYYGVHAPPTIYVDEAGRRSKLAKLR